jgi:hypothetical protein
VHAIEEARMTTTVDLQLAAQELRAGGWAPIPDETHGLIADEDSVALLTVAGRTAPQDAAVAR